MSDRFIDGTEGVEQIRDLLRKDEVPTDVKHMQVHHKYNHLTQFVKRTFSWKFSNLQKEFVSNRRKQIAICHYSFPNP